MEFVADPDVFDFIRLLELIDNALADIAEGSDVIGEDSYFYAHVMPKSDNIAEKIYPIFCRTIRQLSTSSERVNKKLLDNRTIVLYTGIMQEKRTIQTVQKSITAFFQENRRMPSYQEMIDLLGVRSKSVVNFWIDKLIDANLLEKDNKGHLAFTKNASAIPVAGTVQAGFPSPEEETLCDVMSMDEYLVTKPDVSFLLKVSGDSMTGAGIMEGDLVIVEKGRNPKTGDIVIAEVDGEWTMKYFRKEGSRVVLEAANLKYPIIRPKSDLRLGGVITAVIRKYHQ